MKGKDSGPTRLFPEELGERVVLLLLAVEAISVFLLWTLDPLTSQGQDAFALFLAVDLMAFAMMSYVYRTLSAGGSVSRVFVVAGCGFIAVLLLASFTLPV
jgi:hypothetical protein